VTAAERARRAAAVRASRQGEAPADDPQVPPARTGYVRTDPVRWTVDLPPARDAAAKAWRDETSVQLGLPPGRRGVTNQALLAALVAELLSDESMARRVRARLAQEYGRQ
jgi:hypothetical protein